MSDSIQPIDSNVLGRLAALRRRVKRLAITHGFSTWLAASLSLLIGSFYLDRFLAPPYVMRLLVAPAVWIAIGTGFYFFVLRRMRIQLTDDDAALLVERNNPELRDRLISAVQLSRNSAGADPELVQAAIRGGEEASRNIRFLDSVQAGPTRLRTLGGLLAASVTALVVYQHPADAGVFLQRLLGMRVDFSKRTRLEISIPTRSTSVRITQEGGTIRARVSKGADLAVKVTAVGAAPDLVELHTKDGQVIPLSRIPPNEYLGRFHNIRNPFEFYAIGGDDRDTLPNVVVETVVPPSLAKIQAAVEPPAYSAQAPFQRDGGSFEALVGSKATLRIETATPVKRAVLRYRGADEEIQFQPAEIVGDGPPSNAAPGAKRFSLELVVEKNVRYSVELEDAEGLRNPDPGSYSIVALMDRAPEVKLQVPGRTEIDVSPVGTIALQAKASDDFGVLSVKARYRINGKGELRDLPLARFAGVNANVTRGAGVESRPGVGTAPGDASVAPGTPIPDGSSARTLFARGRLDLTEIRVAAETGNGPTDEGGGAVAPGGSAPGAHAGAPRPLTERDSIEFYIEAIDGRNPKPNVGESFRVRATVMPASDIMKRITERFSRSRDTVQSLLDMQSERRRRVNDLMESFDRAAVSSVLVGQNRITIDSKALARDFFDGVESAAANRLDPIGEAATRELDRLRTEIASAMEDPFSTEVAQSLISAIRSGSLGSPQEISELAEMLAEAITVAAEASPAAGRALDAALLAVETSASVAELQKARNAQDVSVASLEKLLGLLSKWANFQDVVSGAKDLLDQQKSLRAKTKDRVQPTTPVK